MILLRKEFGNKQQIIEKLLQQIWGNVRPIHQTENVNFSNDVNKDVNIRSSKDKTSKFQSSSKLINDNAMEKSALATEKINIQGNAVRKVSRKRFYELKEKK